MGNKSNKIIDAISIGSFVMAIFFAGFIYGVVAYNKKIFPYNTIRDASRTAKELISRKDRVTKPLHLNRARYKGEGVTIDISDKVFHGVTFIAVPWKNQTNWNHGFRLINEKGQVLHEWKIDPRSVWKRDPHQDYAVGSKGDKENTYVHGSLLLPSGDIVCNLDHYGLVRLNKNSEVVWKLPYRTHHSVFEDDKGHFWVCGMKFRENANPNYVGVGPRFHEDTILKVSPDGVIEREISLLEIIYRSGYEGVLRTFSDDVLHMNDVEVLGKDKADAFKGIFQVGDIMVSMCRINTIFVIDGKTERIKWSLTGPFIGQHDPDFEKDGSITVTDNYTERWQEDPYNRRGSRILKIQPLTKEVATLYGWKRNQYFFTVAGGDHQCLSNGNILITESKAGRIFEVDSKQEIVWEWIAKRWDKSSVPEILGGTRYGVEYSDFINKDD